MADQPPVVAEGDVGHDAVRCPVGAGHDEE